MPYQLLKAFRSLFEGEIYRHRSSTNGDRVAYELYEDLLAVARSPKLVATITAGTRVVNTPNRATGRYVRRGDGSFGELLPHVSPIAVVGYAVRRGPIASIEIGAETKILATAIGKQVQERIVSLTDQAKVFRDGNPEIICVAIVAINYAPLYEAYEGERIQVTNGGKYAHPIQQAAVAEAKVRAELKHVYEEIIILPFIATNKDPFSFDWVDATKVEHEYGAALLRISQMYEKRF